MPGNLLLTGPPRSGKTTVLEAVVASLAEAGFEAGGVVCPEIRADGDRVGFEIVDVATGDSWVMAHVDLETGPSVGKYHVDVDAIDRACEAAFGRAVEAADLLVIDEIAPMEVHSEVFVDAVRRALDADRPVVAVVHQRSTTGFIGEVKDRDDTATFEVTGENRDSLPATITERVRETIRS